MNSLKVFGATGGISGSGTSAADKGGHPAAVSGNEHRNTTESASTESYGLPGNRLLLQRDLQDGTDKQLLQIHVHRESRECFLLCLFFCLPVPTRYGAVQVENDMIVCSPCRPYCINETAKYTNPNGPCSTSVVVPIPASEFSSRSAGSFYWLEFELP